MIDSSKQEDRLRFADLITSMDIPELRRTDYRWFIRNAAIRNRAHPNFTQAMQLAKSLTNSTHWETK